MRVIAVQLPAAERSVQDARELIRNRLRDELPAITLYDLLTVVSETVSNAIRHGQGEVGVTIDLSPEGKVTGEIRNEGEGPVHRRPICLEEGTGFGLHIVNAVAENWRVTSDGDTRVAFELRMP